MRLSAHRRPAFTLLEVMVMISIIAILATLSTAAVMRVQSSQREGNTSKDLLKVQMALDQQWRNAGDAIKKEQPHAIIKAITANGDCSANESRARALHLKLRLRQEFPQTFAEATFSFSGQWQDPCTKQVYNLSALNAMYGPKLIYTNAISGANTNNNYPLEGSVLLYLTLSQSRGGAQSNIAETGTAQPADVGNGKMMNVLVDAWGNPLCLRRWVTDAETAAGNELNQEPNVTKKEMASGYKDRDDPEGLLSAAKWGNNGLPGCRAGAAAWFTGPLPTVSDPFAGLNRGPFALSAGKDKTYVTEDDIYSFRIQNLGKGN